MHSNALHELHLYESRCFSIHILIHHSKECFWPLHSYILTYRVLEDIQIYHSAFFSPMFRNLIRIYTNKMLIQVVAWQFQSLFKNQFLSPGKIHCHTSICYLLQTIRMWIDFLKILAILLSLWLTSPDPKTCLI